MAKINDTTDYANVSPADADHVIGTDVSDTTNDANGETATFTFTAIKSFLKTYFDTLYYGSGDSPTFADVTADNVITDYSLSERNKIINGNFDVWQRGTSQTSSGYGSDDRWYNVHLGATKTASRQDFTLGQTDVPGNPQYYSRTVVSGAAGSSAFARKQQSIWRVKTFSGQSVTLSFWAKADASKNIALEFVQDFGSGGSPSTEVNSIESQLIALTTSWQKFEITASIPSISGKTLGTNGDDFLSLNFWLTAGSSLNSRTASLGLQSGTFDIAKVQLEAGTVATPFEDRSYEDTYRRCLPYYFRIKYDVADQPVGMGYLSAAGGQVFGFIQLPLPMIQIPHTFEASSTASHYNVYQNNISRTCTSVPVMQADNRYSPQVRFTASGISGSNGEATLMRFNNSAAYLAFDAELS